MAFFKSAHRSILILTIILVALGTAGVVHAEETAPELYTLETSLRVQNVGTTVSRFVRVRAPLLSAGSRYGTVLEETYNLEPDEIVEENGKRIGVFYIRNLQPGASFTLRIGYTVDRTQREAAAVEHAWEALDEPKVAADDPGIVQAAQRVTHGVSEGQAKIDALLEFTHNHVRYDRESPYRNQGATTALAHGEGVCEDYATLFVSLARASGIDARMVYGYYYSTNREAWERHAWAEYRLGDDLGWQSVDPTMGTAIGVDAYGTYIAQWHRDLPTRMGFVGGQISAGMDTAVNAAQ